MKFKGSLKREEADIKENEIVFWCDTLVTFIKGPEM